MLPGVNYAVGRHHDCAAGVTAVALGEAGLDKLAALAKQHCTQSAQHSLLNFVAFFHTLEKFTYNSTETSVY